MKYIKKNKFYNFCIEYFGDKNTIVLVSFLIIVIIIGVISSNIIPYIYGKMVDLITEKNTNDLLSFIAIYLFIAIINLIATGVENYLGSILNISVSNKAKNYVFENILRMKSKYIDEVTVGEFISRLNSDSNKIVGFIIDVITSIVFIIINFTVGTYFIIKISTQLSLMAAIFLIGIYLVYFAFKKRLYSISREQMKISDKYYSFISESLINVVGIKVFRLEELILKKFKNLLYKQVKLQKESLKMENAASFLNNILGEIFSVFIIYVASIYISNGNLTIGDLVTFNIYRQKLFFSFEKIQSLNIEKQSTFVALERFDYITNLPRENIEIESNNLVIDNIYSLEMKNIKFAYNETDILKDINLCIEKNGLYSIVGKNGSGKTTIMKILLKLYDYSNGDILINGINYKKISVREIREKITYIQKEIVIFNDNFYTNIKMANPDISEEEIINICKRVKLHDFIISLPEGYNTFLKENGNLLSSGLKQKLSFGRALARKTKLILLDEVTSDLDGEAEKEMVNIVKEISKECIVISISHKVNSIINSDFIYLLSDGKIKDCGIHEELISRNKIYRNLFQNLSDAKE